MFSYSSFSPQSPFAATPPLGATGGSLSPLTPGTAQHGKDKFSKNHGEAGHETKPEAPKATGLKGFAIGLKNGLVNTVKGLFTVPGFLLAAGTIGLVAATGGAALLPLAALGVGVGGYQVAKGAIQGNTEKMGEGAFTMGSSLLGAKFTPGKIGGQQLANPSLWGKLKALVGAKGSFENPETTFLSASKDATSKTWAGLRDKVNGAWHSGKNKGTETTPVTQENLAKLETQSAASQRTNHSEGSFHTAPSQISSGNSNSTFSGSSRSGIDKWRQSVPPNGPDSEVASVQGSISSQGTASSRSTELDMPGSFSPKKTPTANAIDEGRQASAGTTQQAETPAGGMKDAAVQTSTLAESSGSKTASSADDASSVYHSAVSNIDEPKVSAWGKAKTYINKALYSRGNAGGIMGNTFSGTVYKPSEAKEATPQVPNPGTIYY